MCKHAAVRQRCTLSCKGGLLHFYITAQARASSKHSQVLCASVPESHSCAGFLQALTSLEVAGNQLEALPEEIGGLSALQKLAAFGNHLQTLPEGLGGLAAVREVWLQGNQLTALPAAIGQLTVCLVKQWTAIKADSGCTRGMLISP
jgi:Leucine-rich repeat (LRR) protein